jgi:hypothetical protein
MARSVVYLLSADLDERLSAEGATEQRTDTSGSGTAVHATTVAACIDYACNTVDFYCLIVGYTVALLATSLWVKDRAIDLAVCRYRSRRGESRTEAEKEACASAVKDLLDIRNRIVPIPDLDTPTGWGRVTSARIRHPAEVDIEDTHTREYDQAGELVHDDADDV